MLDVFKKPYVYGGFALVAVVGWSLVSAGGAILHGHPSYSVVYVGSAVVGTVAMVLGVVWRSRRTRLWLAGVATMGLVLTASLAWWLTPFSATDRALSALQSDEAVVVASSSSQITMTPAGSGSGVGVIFQPGARIDARAYAPTLRPLAEAGHHVVIVKQPLGVAFLAAGFAPDWAEEHPEISNWVVAGHSLGGVVAAENAAQPDAVGDLVLWASFPAADLSAELFDALSVYGTNDTLTTTDDIDASMRNLPVGTAFVPVAGAIHSSFGDYGSQPGDGDPGISRERAQTLIIQTTLTFLAGVAEASPAG
jgi:Alpha/beta hydrolase family